MAQVKSKRICMESSEHNLADISGTICPKMLMFGKKASWTLFFQNVLTNPIISQKKQGWFYSQEYIQYFGRHGLPSSGSYIYIRSWRRKVVPSEIFAKKIYIYIYIYIFPTVKSALLLLFNIIFTYCWSDPLLGPGTSFFFVSWSLRQKLNKLILKKKCKADSVQSGYINIVLSICWKARPRL